MSPSRTPLRRREPTRRNRGHLTILDAMDDENLFAPHFDNAESWVAWRAFLAVLFGYPVDEQQRELFRQCTGREHVNSDTSRGMDGHRPPRREVFRPRAHRR